MCVCVCVNEDYNNQKIKSKIIKINIYFYGFGSTPFSKESCVTKLYLKKKKKYETPEDKKKEVNRYRIDKKVTLRLNRLIRDISALLLEIM